VKYFQFLTDTAYVQTGEYKVRKFYKEGQHWLQGVGDVVGDKSVSLGTSFPQTAATSGLHRIVTTLTASSNTTDYQITVDGKVVLSGSVGVGTPVTLDEVVEVASGQVISLVTVPGGGTITPSGTAITFTGDKSFPSTFSADWAVFSDGRDDLKGYDPGAYSIGIKPSVSIITVPLLKKVSLLYLVSNNSTQEQRTLVQYDGDIDALDSAGIVDKVSTGSPTGEGKATRVTWTDQGYIEKFAPAGYNRFGKVLPKGIAESDVNELTSFTGSFQLTDGSTSTVTAYFQPIYMYNQLPLFDYVYLQGGFAGDFTADKGIEIPGHFLRWLGYAPSENIAPINRAGSGLVRDGYIWDSSAMKTPSDVDIVDDGTTIKGADAYNVRNFRRY